MASRTTASQSQRSCLGVAPALAAAYHRPKLLFQGTRSGGWEEFRAMVMPARPPARSLIPLLHYPQGTGVEEANWVSPFKPRLCSFQWLPQEFFMLPSQKPAN